MTRGRKILAIVAAVLLVPFVLLAGLVVVAQSEWAERRVEKIVSAKLDREVEIDGISFRWGWPPGIIFAKLRIGNPTWAKTPALIDAEGLYARVAVAPLFAGHLVLPYLGARRAEAGLEMDGDKATWRFGPKSDAPSRLLLTRIYLDDGRIAYIDHQEDTDLAIDVKGSLGTGGELKAEARGKFRGESTRATASLPELSTQHKAPVRFEGRATVGKTRASADGVLATDGSSLDFNLKLAGASLKDLGKVTGIVFPDTPPYQLAGHLKHAGTRWDFSEFNGRVGESDLAGNVIYNKVKPRPFFQAALHSKLLDLDDLGPLIGAPPKTGAGESASAEQRAKSAQRAATGRILPDTEFSTQVWGKMDADVKLDAKRVQRPKQLPLDALQAHLVLKDSVLHLQPLNFTMAEGRVTSNITLDPHQNPMRGVMKVDVQGLKLRSLFPTLESMKEALGTLYGNADLVGHGQSVAALLGSSDGRAGFAVEGGRISALLGQLIELDVAHAAMLLGKRYKQTELHCAASALEVKDGVANTRDFVIDTDDTQINIAGKIDLKGERVELETRPKPKDTTLLSLRTPIMLEGPMRKPKVHVKPGPIAARVAGAIALGAAAPPLAVLALADTPRGKDVDCGRLIAEAKAEGAVKKAG